MQIEPIQSEWRTERIEYQISVSKGLSRYQPSEQLSRLNHKDN